MKRHRRLINSYFIVLLFSAGWLTLCHAASYPDIQGIFEPTTNYPSAFAPFNPPVDSSYRIHTNAPQIAEWTRQNNPGDTMALTGENLSVYTDQSSEGRDTHFVFFGNGFPTADGMINRLSGRLCAVALPENLPQNDTYLMWSRNEHGFGEPVVINQTEAWWVGPDLLSPGEAFSIYGRNLTLENGASYAYIDGHGWITSTTANPYKADFVVPSELTNGTYMIYAHNGHGGKYGWSTTGISFNVLDPVVWSEDTNTWYNVKSYGALGDGVTDDTDAINTCVSAAKVGSDYHTVYFPAGAYLVSAPIYPNDINLRYKGDGMDVTLVQGASDQFDTSVYDTIFVVASDTTVEDLSVNKGDLDVRCLRVQGGGSVKHRILLNRVRLSTLSNGPLVATGGRSALHFSSAENFVAKDSVFITGHSLDGGMTRQIHFSGCEFIGISDNNGLMSFAGAEFSMENCYAHPFNAADASSSLGWGKGRWVFGGGTISKVYLGDNLSTNMAPRYADPFQYEHPIAVSKWGWVNPLETYSWSDATQTVTMATLDRESIPNVQAYFGTNPDDPRPEWGLQILDWNHETGEVVLKGQGKTMLDEGNTNAYVGFFEIVDQNSGEQFLWEAMNAYYTGYPAGITNPSNLAFADLSKNLSGLTLIIAEGRGAGQSRKLTADDTSGGNVKLVTPFRVMPDSTSLCKIGKFMDRVAVYNNNLNGVDRVAAAGSVQTATTGFSCYGGASRLVIDGNRYSKLATGVVLWSGADTIPNNIIQPNVFNVVKNNTIDTCKNGLALVINDWNYAVASNKTFYGNVIRHNLIKKSSQAAIQVGTSSGRQRMDLCVYDQNTITNNMKFFDGPSDMVLFDQVWSGNAIKQDDQSGLFYSGEQSHVLKNNNWSGIAMNYFGAVPGGVLELPHKVVYLNQTVKNVTIPLWNCGTAAMEWSVDTSAAPWLSVSPSTGSTANEQTSNLTFSLSSEPASDTSAVIAVTAGGISKQLTVYYSTAQVISSTQVIFPLSDFAGSQVRAILTDEVTNAERDLGEVQNLTELVINNLIPGHWYKLIFERFNTSSGTWIKVEERYFKM